MNLPVLPLAIGVLIFAFASEFLQYLKIVEMLGLQTYALARTVIGTSFAWLDLLAYAAGIAVVLVVEHQLKRVA